MEKGMQKVTDEQTIQRVLSKCVSDYNYHFYVKITNLQPWNKTQSNIFGTEGDDEIPREVARLSTTSIRQNNQV
jgi:hypothetical protein